MGWYEAIKDGISVAQKVDNIPLVTSLIDAQKQILDLIHENEGLKNENKKLNELKDISNVIERHKDAYITLKDDEIKLIYCTNCWDKDKKLVQAQTDDEWGKYDCPLCKYRGYFDSAKYNSRSEQASNRNKSRSIFIV